MHAGTPLNEKKLNVNIIIINKAKVHLKHRANEYVG